MTSLHEKHISFSCQIRETVKLFLSNNVQPSERIKLAEEDDTLNHRPSYFESIVKCRKHPSVIAIASELTKENFSFKTIAIEDALKEISMLDSSKAIQATDIPGKVIKGNSNIFAKQIYAYFNESIGKGKFSNCLKLSNTTPEEWCTYFKKIIRDQ